MARMLTLANAGPCPLWVNFCRDSTNSQCPLYPRKRTLVTHHAVSGSAIRQAPDACAPRASRPRCWSATTARVLRTARAAGARGMTAPGRGWSPPRVTNGRAFDLPPNSPDCNAHNEIGACHRLDEARGPFLAGSLVVRSSGNLGSATYARRALRQDEVPDARREIAVSYR
jgi:hypothetical protein